MLSLPTNVRFFVTDERKSPASPPFTAMTLPPTCVKARLSSAAPVAITSPVTVLEPNGKLLPEIEKVAEAPAPTLRSPLIVTFRSVQLAPAGTTTSPSMVNDWPGTSELITPVQVVVSAAAALAGKIAKNATANVTTVIRNIRSPPEDGSGANIARTRRLLAMSFVAARHS